MSVTINGSAGVTTNSGAVYNGLQTGTAVASTSGTSIDFTSIPSWAKRITIMLASVSGNGSSDLLFQLGDSGGIENTGYLGAGSIIGASSVITANYTAGFGVSWGSVTAKSWGGHIIFTNVSGNIWIASGTFGRSDSTTTAITAGNKTLSDILTQVRITSSTGTDVFDAGFINIIYE